MNNNVIFIPCEEEKYVLCYVKRHIYLWQLLLNKRNKIHPAENRMILSLRQSEQYNQANLACFTGDTGNMWNMALTQVFNQGNSRLLFYRYYISVLANIQYLILKTILADSNSVPIVSYILKPIYWLGHINIPWVY